jgi:uncharacterized damage-inducible protein DinB
MPDLQTINDLFGHMQWADATVWRTVFDNPVAIGDARLRSSLYHLHVVQRAFLKMWRYESFEEPFPQFTSTIELHGWSKGYYDEARAYLNGLGVEGLAQTAPQPWTELIATRIGRTPEATSIGETALQVVMHSTYHRGQVNAQLRTLGGEPPLVDYITWLWLGRPESSSS